MRTVVLNLSETELLIGGRFARGGLCLARVAEHANNLDLDQPKADNRYLNSIWYPKGVFYEKSVFQVVFAYAIIVSVLISTMGVSLSAQSRPQKPDPNTGSGKKNTRPTPPTEEELKKIEEEKRRAEEEKNAIIDDTIEKIETNVVSVDAVVINKKTGQIISGLKKGNFAIFENGVKQEISNFATPESPITVTLSLNTVNGARFLVCSRRPL